MSAQPMIRMVCKAAAVFRAPNGEDVFEVRPDMRFTLIEAPAAIRSDPLFAWMEADGTVSVASDPAARKTPENDAQITDTDTRKTPENGAEKTDADTRKTPENGAEKTDAAAAPRAARSGRR